MRRQSFCLLYPWCLFGCSWLDPRIAPTSHDRFESCASRISPKMLDVTTDLNRSVDSNPTQCNDKTEVALFEAKDQCSSSAFVRCFAKQVPVPVVNTSVNRMVCLFPKVKHQVWHSTVVQSINKSP